METTVVLTEEAERIPTPGHPDAVRSGCLCPQIDNHYGKGAPYPDGQRFIVRGDCPLHVRSNG